MRSATANSKATRNFSGGFKKTIVRISGDYDDEYRFVISVDVIDGALKGVIRDGEANIIHSYSTPGWKAKLLSGEIFIHYNSKPDKAVIGALKGGVRIWNMSETKEWKPVELPTGYKCAITGLPGALFPFTQEDIDRTWAFTSGKKKLKTPEMLEDRSAW